MNSWRFWMFLAAVSGALVVGLGAHGYHALPEEPKIRGALNIAIQYHMFHTLALLAVVWMKKAAEDAKVDYWAQRAGWAFFTGLLFFCGSLYAYALTGENPAPAATPIGGGMFLIGWAMLAWATIRKTRARG